MTIVDDRGRLFGRVNIIDAAVVVFVLGLIPLGYGTFLLFRPTTPRIDSVTRSEVSREERRIATGGLLTAKLKVRGTGFNPLLRAWIDGTQAMGFVFENPNSADVLVGAVAPGTHDLILFDGVQEVARAHGAVTITDAARASIRAVGWLTNLDPAMADTLKAGFVDPQPTPSFEIIAVGPVQPARSRISVGQSRTDLPIEGRVEREAVITIHCDPSPDLSTCNVGIRTVGDPAPVVVTLAGFRFEMSDVLPTAEPRQARVQLRLSGAGVPAKIGDRDAFLDQRAAVITAVEGRGGDAMATLDLGLDASRDGWRYRSQIVKPGAPLVLTTDRYVAVGQVVAVDLRK